MAQAMLTTVDNPHDPRTNFTEWFAWDNANGYNSCAYLARVAAVGIGLPAQIQEKQNEDAIDEIIRIHAGGLYKKLIV